MRHDIRIKVKVAYLPQQSEPQENKYFFTYTITITNKGSTETQLLSREWLIIDSNDLRQEVVGEGVVGQQPTIEKGASFTYTSGVMLDTPVGTMQGRYTFIDADGKFEVEIPPFLLALPGIVH